MTLSDPRASEIRAALASLRARAEIAEQQPTLDETRRAVMSVREAVFRALVLIDQAEFETRTEALARVA